MKPLIQSPKSGRCGVMIVSQGEHEEVQIG